jgi:hypothetical protein
VQEAVTGVQEAGAVRETVAGVQEGVREAVHSLLVRPAYGVVTGGYYFLLLFFFYVFFVQPA